MTAINQVLNCPNCNGIARQYATVRNSPYLQNILYTDRTSALAASVLQEVVFFFCENCIYLFNPKFQSELVEYDRNYNNDQSYSAVNVQHIHNVADNLNQTIGGISDKKILEIGCGNGHLLGMLHQKGGLVTGYDPAYQGRFGVEQYVKKRYWKYEPGTSYDLIVLRLVLEGLNNPEELFKEMSQASTQHSYLYLELIDSAEIIRLGNTNSLYHECARYFSSSSIALFLARFGFETTKILSYDGGWLGILARRLVPAPSKVNLTFLQQHRRILIWGMAGRSIQFLLNNSLGVEAIEYAVDIDPVKQGKYIPGTGQKILSPEEAVVYNPDLVIVLNASYSDEVRSVFTANEPRIITSSEIFELDHT